MNTQKLFNNINKMDINFIISLLCIVTLAYILFKMLIKLANVLIIPILMSFVAAVIFYPELLEFAKDVLRSNINLVTKCLT